jgi:hypothetical protein
LRATSAGNSAAATTENEADALAFPSGAVASIRYFPRLVAFAKVVLNVPVADGLAASVATIAPFGPTTFNVTELLLPTRPVDPEIVTVPAGITFVGKTVTSIGNGPDFTSCAAAAAAATNVIATKANPRRRSRVAQAIIGRRIPPRTGLPSQLRRWLARSIFTSSS